MLSRRFGAKVTVLELPEVVELSSTEIRARLAGGEGGEGLDSAVYGYILCHGLYGTHADLHHLPLSQLRPAALSLLRHKRIPHVLGTEETAARLARRWGADEEEARRAALLHDCTKKLSREEHLALCRQYHIELDEYELLAVLNNKDWADGNMLLVIAQPEDNGSYAQHSLMLSGLQLARLWQEKQIQWIEMRNGEAGVLLRIDELLSGNVAKYVDWALRDPEAAKPEAVENLPEVELTAVQLEHVRFEVRIEPGEEGTYRFGVYVWFAGEQPSVAELMSSLKVCLSAGEQGGEAERNAYVEAHALSATDEMGAVEYLESALIETPVRETGGQDQLSEYFNVEIDSEEHAIVLYDPEKSLDAHRRWSMCADWAGNVEYCLVELDG